MEYIAEFQQTIKQNNQIHIGKGVLKSVVSIDTSDYSGVVEYYPEELVITLKAGTSIAEIHAILNEKKQALVFYTPNLEQSIGALYATAGADLADSVLGVQIINGKGELMNFGGQVMKNVAGYDVSRLLVGSQGKLALITQISFKILPKVAAQEYQKKPQAKQSVSELHNILTQKLKKIFDPYGIFI